MKAEDDARMRLAARAILFPVSLAVAGAAGLHAASETGLAPPGMEVSVPSSLVAHALAEIVDHGFKAEVSSHDPQDQGEFPRLSEPLIALARKSFALDPLEVSTIRTIALGSLLQEDRNRAREVMRLAARISKRDAVTDIWLAQDYGSAGNTEAMMGAFDHTLRTSVRAREFAMKPLVDTLADRNTYAPLGKLLARRPEWERDFWNEFVGNPVALQNAANFFAGSSLQLDRLPPDHRVVLYANLKNAGQFETLYRLAAVDPDAGASNDDLAAGQFVDARDGKPLGWTTHSRGSYAARIQDVSGELQIDARAGSFGRAAERIVRVDGGYTLAITMAEAVPEPARLELAVRCADAGGQELGKLSLGPGEEAGELALSAGGCKFANLELSFTADPGRRDALIRIAKIVLRPT